MWISDRFESVSSRPWIVLFAAFAAMLFTAGCQSCQGNKDVPPRTTSNSAKEPAKAAEPQGHSVTLHTDGMDELDEDDEDALVLLAEGEPEEGTAPLSVKLVVESLVDDEMDHPKYDWEFGDGTPNSNEASPTHVYEKPGSYTVTIRIVDAKGMRGWDEVDIEVEEPE